MTDVSPLRGVETLGLFQFRGIVDVNVLGGTGSKVRKLTIRCCNDIRDISCLGDIEELRIFQYDNITTFMSRCTSRVVYQTHNRNIVDVSIFSGVWDLDLVDVGT